MKVAEFKLLLDNLTFELSDLGFNISDIEIEIECECDGRKGGGEIQNIYRDSRGVIVITD